LGTRPSVVPPALDPSPIRASRRRGVPQRRTGRRHWFRLVVARPCPAFVQCLFLQVPFRCATSPCRMPRLRRRMPTRRASVSRRRLALHAHVIARQSVPMRRRRRRLAALAPRCFITPASRRTSPSFSCL
jgi:hypothetical protein